MSSLSWTQPICRKCWSSRFLFEEEPTRLLIAEWEKCAYCGLSTNSGIYVRDDPKNVAFPQPKEA